MKVNKCKENQVFVRDHFWYDIQNNSNKYAHIIMIATKPDIIKQAPLYLELKKRWELVILVHTGQHYDYEMSRSFFKELKISKPDYNLGISKGSNVVQLADLLKKLEDLEKEE